MSNISQRIERLPVTLLLWRVLLLTGIGWLFDAMDQGMVAGVMAAIGKGWKLTPADLGLLGSASAVGMAVGAAAALIAYLLIPVYGWRIGFFLGGIPALYAAYLRKGIPESPRYLEQKGRIQEADEIVSKMEQQAGVSNKGMSPAKGQLEVKKSNFTLIDLWSRAYIRRTFVLWTLWLGINFGYYGFVLWTPTLLVGKGFSLVRGFEFTLIMSLAQLPGYYSAAYLIEKIGRKAVLVIYLGGTALSAYLYGQAASVNTVLIFGCLLYFFSLGAWGAVYAYTPEVYPTAARGSGAGWAAAVGRIGAIAAPYIVGLVYAAKGKQAGFTYVFLILTIVFAVVALVIAIAGIETKGLALDEINESKA